MRKVSYRLPMALREHMRHAVREGPGPKAKSEWVRHALAELMSVDPGLACVGLGEALAENDANDVVNFDTEAANLLDRACSIVRRQDPLFQGVQSAVIRAVLRYALERDAKLRD